MGVNAVEALGDIQFHQLIVFFLGSMIAIRLIELIYVAVFSINEKRSKVLVFLPVLLDFRDIGRQAFLMQPIIVKCELSYTGRSPDGELTQRCIVENELFASIVKIRNLELTPRVRNTQFPELCFFVAYIVTEWRKKMRRLRCRVSR
jgi:hypothetical protein